MDDAIDQMNKTAKTIMLFEVTQLRSRRCSRWATIIVKAAELVLEAMPLLSSISENAGRLNALTEEIIRIEEQADELHDQGRKALFLANRDGGNAMGFIIGNEIYDHLEKVVDRFEDVANEINGSSSITSDGRDGDGREPRPAGPDRPDRRRAGVRLPQRPARCRQLDRDHRLDPRAAAALCGDVGGVLQLHRVPVLRPARGADRRASASSPPTWSMRGSSSAR